MIITIDGPAGSGKTTIAKRVASHLHFAYLDTGALYRALAYSLLSDGIDIHDEASVEAILSSYSFDLTPQKQYVINGSDTTPYLRTQEVANSASIISAYRSVRTFLLPVQREFALKRDMVCEGRDMGTTVFPTAEIKIFLTALPEVRARRRLLELQPTTLTLEDLRKQIIERDERDMSRAISPLVKPEKCIVIDTSDLSIDQVVDEILSVTRGPSWEHFQHQADIGIRGMGATIEQTFEQAALALTAVITDPKKIKQEKSVEVTCEGVDHEMLLIDWLNRLIYEMECHQMLFSKFEVTIRGNSLSALLLGEKIDRKRHKMAVEVKAATYNSLRVHRQDSGTWVAECVVDV